MFPVNICHPKLRAYQHSDFVSISETRYTSDSSFLCLRILKRQLLPKWVKYRERNFVFAGSFFVEEKNVLFVAVFRHVTEKKTNNERHYLNASNVC